MNDSDNIQAINANIARRNKAVKRREIGKRLEALARSAAIEPCYWEDAEGQNAIRLKELADLGRELAELDGEGKG